MSTDENFMRLPSSLHQFLSSEKSLLPTNPISHNYATIVFENPLDKDERGNSKEGEGVEEDREDREVEEDGAEEEDREESITSQVERHPFVLVIKTMTTFGAGVKFQKFKKKFMSMLPENIKLEEAVFNSVGFDREMLFMNSRRGLVVPSAFL